MNMRRFLAVLVATVALLSAACSDGDNPTPTPEPPKPDPNPEQLFTITVTDISAVMATVTVEPRDNAMTYYCDVLNEEGYLQVVEDGVDRYLDWYITKLMDDYGMSFAETVELISARGKDDYTLTTLTPGTKYYVLAVGIDGQGVSTTPLESFAFETLAAVSSTNDFQFTVTDVSRFGAKIAVGTVNDDPYFLDIQPEGMDEGMSGEEFARYLINRYLSWGGMADLCHEGAYAYEEQNLKPGWKYELVAFGYDEGCITTPVRRASLETLPGGDPAACTFRFENALHAVKKCRFDFIPSDESVVYICDVITEDEYAQCVREHGSTDAGMRPVLSAMIDYYSSDFANRTETVDMLSACGETSFELRLSPRTEYRMWAVAVDQQGNPTASFAVSEKFSSPELVGSTASVTLENYVWYDGEELYRQAPEAFGDIREYAVMAVNVLPSEDAAHWYVYAFYGDLRESSEWNIINNLFMAGEEAMDMEANLILCYWGENTICAVAEDADGNYGSVLREVVNLTKEGASPAPDFSTVGADVNTRFRTAPRLHSVSAGRAPLLPRERR